MNIADTEGRYYRAMRKLSDLVTRRNQALLELQGMCDQSVTSMPSSGFVLPFDVVRARALVKRISRHNSQIERAMTSLNKYAERIDQRQVQWMQDEHEGEAGSETESPSAA